MAIKVTNAQLDAIKQHGERTYPHECCGFLLGAIADDLNQLAEVYPAENEWAESIRSVVNEDRQRITVYSKRPARTLVEIVKWVDTNGFELDDVHLTRPTLEDVFIELTGKKLRE